MKETNTAIVKRYIQEKGYEYSSKTLAIIFYGSRATNEAEDSADFDLLIMTTSQKADEKKTEIWNRCTFKYEKRSYESIVNNWEKDYVMMSIIAYGKIMFSKGGNIDVLRIMVLKKIKEPIKELDENEKQRYYITVENRILELRKVYNEKSPEFNHLAHITIEKIRKFYERAKCLPHIRTSKVYRVYTDTEYYTQNFKGIKLPEEKFIKLYLSAVTDNFNMQSIEMLWKYCKERY